MPDRQQALVLTSNDSVQSNTGSSCLCQYVYTLYYRCIYNVNIYVTWSLRMLYIYKRCHSELICMIHISSEWHLSGTLVSSMYCKHLYIFIYTTSTTHVKILSSVYVEHNVERIWTYTSNETCVQAGMQGEPRTSSQSQTSCWCQACPLAGST